MFPYLRDVKYPVQKEIIIEMAKDNGASPEIVETLDEIPKGNYFGRLDIVQELHDVGIQDDVNHLHSDTSSSKNTYWY